MMIRGNGRVFSVLSINLFLWIEGLPVREELQIKGEQVADFTQNAIEFDYSVFPKGELE
jgi:hypothetical protein